MLQREREVPSRLLRLYLLASLRFQVFKGNISFQMDYEPNLQLQELVNYWNKGQNLARTTIMRESHMVKDGRLL